MIEYEVWFSAQPVTFRGEVVDWNYGKGHYVRGRMTLCGKAVGGDRWERANHLTGSEPDCVTCKRARGLA